MNLPAKLALGAGALLTTSILYEAAEIATMTYTVTNDELTQQRGLLLPTEQRIHYDDIICYTTETTDADELLNTKTLHVTIETTGQTEHEHETITLDFVPPTTREFFDKLSEE